MILYVFQKESSRTDKSYSVSQFLAKSKSVWLSRQLFQKHSSCEFCQIWKMQDYSWRYQSQEQRSQDNAGLFRHQHSNTGILYPSKPAGRCQAAWHAACAWHLILQKMGMSISSGKQSCHTKISAIHDMVRQNQSVLSSQAKQSWDSNAMLYIWYIMHIWFYNLIWQCRNLTMM